MCRCCQNCWEDIYWNCFEERFCYDESIANYNPEEDEEYLATQKNGSILGRIQPSDNNNLTVPAPICDQPMRRTPTGLMSNAKIHEEDYRRETQTNVPMLGPEILAVFANSQIFQDHQPTKLNRISTKTHLSAGIHSPNREAPTTPKESEQDRLIRRLEASLNGDVLDAQKKSTTIIDTIENNNNNNSSSTSEKRITFTLTSDSSPEGSQTITTKKFDAIAEEDDTNEVVLRPRLIDRHPHLLHGDGVGGIGGGGGGMRVITSPPKKSLRSVKSVPHFNVRGAASETDIFAITGSSGQISMTPEVPSISFSNLPKNYEDTPTIEKYRVSQSLYSIQTANAARASKDDYSMPRYFRRSAMVTQSTEILAGSTSLASVITTTTASSSSIGTSKDDLRRPEKEKSKRLQMLRGNLPPLLIHSVSFRKNRDEGKQVD